MDLKELEALARALMDENDLYDWDFQFDRAKSRFGYCCFKTKVISISAPLAEVNSYEQCFNTVTHEIAHAMLHWSHKHDKVWKAVHKSLGGDGNRFCEASKINLPKSKWLLTCTKCGHESHRDRKTKNSKYLICNHCWIASRTKAEIEWTLTKTSA